jgi:RimJ/RimL family protein N-acetyltransferase
MMKVEPVVLSGGVIRLEPLREHHVEALWIVGSDPDLWRLTSARIYSLADMRAYVNDALRDEEVGRALPFATVEIASGRVIGTTRFGSIAPEHRRVEIGWTFLAKPWQRTAANTEAKYLMLRHAFEVWDCIRVELKTSALNDQSRNAMLRIGAKEEGILRSHMINGDGSIRDTVYYSVIASEWPEVKTNLEKRLPRV